MQSEHSSIVQYVTWILIVVGWVIVNHQNNLRETRKEARAMADNAKKSAIDISLKTVSFLTSQSADGGVELKSSLELLEIELERFPLFSTGSTLMTCFTEFAEAGTGGDFESNVRTRKEPNSSEVSAVYQTRNSLLAEIERQFKVHFC